MNYRLLEIASNHQIYGNVVWYKVHMERFRKEGFDWPSWKDGIVSLVFHVDDFDPSVKERFQVSFLSFHWRGAPYIPCVRVSLIQALGEDLVRSVFHLIPLQFADGKAIDDWVALHPREEGIVLDLKLMPSRPDKREMYTSREFELILSERIYDRVKDLQFRECKWKTLGPDGKAVKDPNPVAKKKPSQVFDLEKLRATAFEGGGKPRAVSPAAVAALEKQIGAKLPEDFRSFLVGCAGLKPASLEFVAEDASTVTVNEFYWITESKEQRNPIERWESSWKDQEEGPGMLPFGGDGFGDLVLIKVKSRNRGAIYRWNHEGQEVKKIAASFGAFAAGLERV